MKKRIVIGIGGLVLAILVAGCSVDATGGRFDDNTGCWTTAECELQNGWDYDDWDAVFLGLNIDLSYAQAGCFADAIMLSHTPEQFLGLDFDGYEEVGIDIARNECRSVMG